jgi:hypothetical protein
MNIYTNAFEYKVMMYYVFKYNTSYKLHEKCFNFKVNYLGI